MSCLVGRDCLLHRITESPADGVSRAQKLIDLEKGLMGAGLAYMLPQLTRELKYTGRPEWLLTEHQRHDACRCPGDHWDWPHLRWQWEVGPSCDRSLRRVFRRPRLD